MSSSPSSRPTAATTILVVDDLERPRRALADALREAGHAVLEAGDGDSAWRAFCRHHPDLVITDMVMPRSDGVDLLARIRSRSEIPVILFTAHGSVEAAVAALKGGADEFVVSSDVDVARLQALVGAALGRCARGAGGEFEARLPGKSATAARVRERVASLALLRAPVLVSGEPGSGRHSVVRALHELGSSAGSEIVALCAREFSSERPLPAGGAVHIEAVHELSPAAQAFWADRLRARPASAGPRVFASTTERIARRVAEGSFHRELGQLFLRFHVPLPPLRRRPEDIPRLAAAMAARISASLSRRPVRLSSSSLDFLHAQRWPGNLSQLEAVLERAIGFSRGTEIRRRVVEEVHAEAQETLASIREQHEAKEREALLRTMRETGGNVSRTAERLGKSRSAVYRLIERHGIPLHREG